MSTASNHPDQSGQTGQPAQAAPPPGWYPDGTGGQRWWNGIEWTADYLPAQATEAAPQAEAQALEAVQAWEQAQAAQAPQTAQAQWQPEQPVWHPAPTAGPAAPAMPLAPRRSRKGLAITLIAGGAVVVLGAVVGAGLFFNSLLGPVPHGSNVNPGLTETPEPLPDEQKSASPSPTETAKPSETPKYTDILAERDQFIRDQKLPLDGSVLKPITEPQKQFVAELTKQYTSLGLTLSEQDVSISLALSADACETSILNSHKVTELIARTHASTSPLISTLVKSTDAANRQTATNGLMKTAVLGVSYMCPADHSQWTTAFNAVNGSW